MKYIFFIAAFNAFFFLGLILNKKPKNLHDKVLISWLLYLGISTAAYSFSMDLFPEATFLSAVLISLFLLHGPFMFLYVKTLSYDKKVFKPRFLLHFIPFVAFLVYLVIAFQFPAYSKNIHVSHDADSPEPPVIFVIFLLATALSGPVYFILAHKEYRLLKKSSENFIAKESRIQWLGKLIFIFGIVWTALIIVAVIHHVFHLFTMTFCTNGLFLALSCFIILIGYFGLNQQEVFVNHPPAHQKTLSNAEEPVKYATSRLEGEELNSCFLMVERFMDAQKPFLDPDLTLPALADGLNVSTHHLSQVINEKHGSNFFDYINRYRVEEVKRKIQMEQYQNYSLLGIALESGFNSKSSFNRVFKQVTGITPSQFKTSLTRD
ncbi:MAG TPA: helix-turn-helix domain-containing protein [Flavobacteriaceae bacterium]|nr:helix-turn-helix domain-containing protein [Flavobacteriaceae bacterium]